MGDTPPSGARARSAQRIGGWVAISVSHTASASGSLNLPVVVECRALVIVVWQLVAELESDAVVLGGQGIALAGEELLRLGVGLVETLSSRR